MAKRIAITRIQMATEPGKPADALTGARAVPPKTKWIKAGTILNLEGDELAELEAMDAVVPLDDQRAKKFGYGPGSEGRVRDARRAPVLARASSEEVHSAKEAVEDGLVEGVDPAEAESGQFDSETITLDKVETAGDARGAEGAGESGGSSDTSGQADQGGEQVTRDERGSDSQRSTRRSRKSNRQGENLV